MKTRSKIDFETLEELYRSYNRYELIHPDPLEFVYRYDDPKDMEIAGLISSSLAYGRVAQILKSVGAILDKMGSSPYLFCSKTSPARLEGMFGNFKHRFTTGQDIVLLIDNVKTAIVEYGSLENCFLEGFSRNAQDMKAAISNFAEKMGFGKVTGRFTLLSSPGNGSACKRLNMYLRWMVRKDQVDPGVWENVPQSKLLVPLDTHMYRICRELGFSRRKQADFKTVLEVTEEFKRINPHDPVKYDFALTRFGIRNDMNLEHRFKKYGIC